MEPVTEAVKLVATFTLSFLFALVLGRLLLSGLLRGLSAAAPRTGERHRAR